jgi:regulator of protease activity HflC (stomatin/prohibitin superfamily)
MWKKYIAVPALVFFAIFIVMCNPFVMVGPGERGIKITLGEVQPEVYGEGLHTIFPFIQTFKTMDIKTQKYTFKTSVYTKDIQ